MNTIKKTVTIDSSRRHLWLDEPLPESAGTGKVDIMIFIRPTPQKRQPVAASEEDDIRWGRGSCKDMVKPGSVERFLAECHADKERELALEKRQAEECARYTGTASA